MSHSIIIIGRDGQEYEYFPPHGRHAESEINALVVVYLQGAKEIAKLHKKFKPKPNPPAELIAEYEALDL